MATFHGIGVMSGTSLDGLDICFAEFTGDIETDVWSYRIEKAKTVPYTDQWRERLKTSMKLSGEQLIQLHVDYGHYIGKTVKAFVDEYEIKVDFIASHGHTVFHQPDKGFTFQLGDGETAAAYLISPYVTNFRSKDLALGGHGAPLAPSGERYLFQQTDICINLGGIANIGVRGSQGYDVSPCNIVFNRLAKLHNSDLQYDKDGQIASMGVVKIDLLKQLDELDYYKMEPPKSLGMEWIIQHIFPLLDDTVYTIQDLMRTFLQHVVNKITEACVGNLYPKEDDHNCTVLITGGGAFNKYFVEILTSKLHEHGIELQETDEETINYKEALLFAFLGLRCLLGLENTCSDVTGSSRDSISGSIHQPVNPTASCSPTLQDRFNHLMRKRSLSTHIPPQFEN
ncbi:anhydro-N-acetylmuramic acid kinase [Patella vulgata]|uniref:anhydro-N-acetylmuramic acid kinase n=1 Tax=Patella vulgata TaxID=6465 RepID=UPI00218088FD|nr:anhydro-N-acetylmuramic acid kinase [Patella vulgata]